MNQIELARELAAMSQTGLHFSKDPHDQERYKRLEEIAATLLEKKSDTKKSKILKWQGEEFGYATPKVDVRAFIVEKNKVFLVKEDLDGGRWSLPGGWADVNSTPSQNIVREVLEESGYKVKVEGLLAVLDREKQGHEPSFPYHVYKMFFQCRIVGGEPKPNRESSECGFFSIKELPELSTSRVLESQLKRFYVKSVSGEPYLTEYD